MPFGSYGRYYCSQAHVPTRGQLLGRLSRPLLHDMLYKNQKETAPGSAAGGDGSYGPSYNHRHVRSRADRGVPLPAHLPAAAREPTDKKELRGCNRIGERPA